MKINYSDEKVLKGEKSIFLAGPTPRSADVNSWRVNACQLLKEKGFHGIVYVPEYSTLKPRADYVNQAMWEREALTRATVIVFWIPRMLPDMAGFTTNVEFGYWLHSGKVIYGRPDSASKVRYLDWLYKMDYGRKVHSDLSSLLGEAINLVDDLYNELDSEILPLADRKIVQYTKRNK